MKIINIIPKTEIKVNGIKGFLKNKVTKYGTGAKVDIPKRYLGNEVYIIIFENGTKKENKRIRKKS
jgi:putative transposon-encoded protein